MKILVISDTHLTDEFEESKFNYLLRLFTSVDRIILNGDFWEGYMISFDSFVNSPWKKLFPILKQKKTMYIYGNHDQKSYCDNRVNLFSTKQTTIYSIKLSGKKFIFEHGHSLLPVYTHIEHLLKSVGRFAIPFLRFGYNFLLSLFGDRFIDIYFRRFNRILKKSLVNVDSDTYYIFGHTHFPELDLIHHFADSGANMFGFGQYLIISNGEIKMIREKYK